MRRKDGTVVAELTDYEAVWELIDDLFVEAVQLTVSKTIRETVKAVQAIKDRSEVVMVTAIARELGIAEPPAWRRVQRAIRDGYLQNLEEKRGRPAIIDFDQDLPEDIIDLLPTPAEVEEEWLLRLVDRYRVQLRDRAVGA